MHQNSAIKLILLFVTTSAIIRCLFALVKRFFKILLKRFVCCTALLQKQLYAFLRKCKAFFYFIFCLHFAFYCVIIAQA
jgi:hypothetical protein